MDKIGTVEQVAEAPVEDTHSPAESIYQSTIDLNKTLNRNPSTTYYCKIKDNSFIDEGVAPNDLLIIDRSIPFTNGKIALCFWEGAHFIRRISIGIDAMLYLESMNEDRELVLISKDNKSMLWGVIGYVIRKL